MKAAIPPALALLFSVHTAAAQTAATASVPETVNVQAAPLSDEAVSSFVTTFTEPSLLSGKIPRWYSGICMKTEGLPPDMANAITRRVLEVAKLAGAPVQNTPCTTNTAVLFDNDPQAVMNDIADFTPGLLGPHEVAQTDEVKKVRFPVQAWYATTTRDNDGAVTVDTKTEAALCGTEDTMILSNKGPTDFEKGPKVNQAAYVDVIKNFMRDCGRRNVAGTHLRDGIHSQLSTVTVVASLDIVKTHTPAALADYLALVILSQTKAFGACEKMDTIANLLVPGCDAASHVNSLTPGDNAFLKALYRADTGGTLIMQRASIRGEMKKILNAP